MLGFERRSVTTDDDEGNSVRLAQYVKFREEKFGGVLFETRSEKVFTLNPTATAVIREIASETRVGATLLRPHAKMFVAGR